MGRGAAPQEAVAARAGAVEGGAVKGEGGGVGATQGGVRAIHEGGGRVWEGEVVVAGRRHQGELERHERRQHAVSVGVVVGERGRAPQALGAELQGGMVLGGGGGTREKPGRDGVGGYRSTEGFRQRGRK